MKAKPEPIIPAPTFEVDGFLFVTTRRGSAVQRIVYDVIDVMWWAPDVGVRFVGEADE